MSGPTLKIQSHVGCRHCQRRPTLGPTLKIQIQVGCRLCQRRPTLGPTLKIQSSGRLPTLSISADIGSDVENPEFRSAADFVDIGRHRVRHWIAAGRSAGDWMTLASIMVYIGRHWPILADVGRHWPDVARHGPTLTDIGRHWADMGPTWADIGQYIGRCGPTLARCWPTLTDIGRH